MKKSPSPDGSNSSTLDLQTTQKALERAEKGSHRPMWELLLQLRVLIPYLSHLMPLLERGSLKPSQDLGEVSKGLAVIQASERELETLARNQAVQLERIDGRVARLQELLEANAEESRRFTAEMRTFRRWMIGITVVIVALVGATAGMVLNIMLRP